MTATVTKPPQTQYAQTRADGFTGGELAYLFSVEQAQKRAAEDPRIKFRQRDGSYQSGPGAVTTESIKDVEIAGRRYVLLAVEDGTDPAKADLKAVSFMEVDAVGNPVRGPDGKVQTYIATAGFTGDPKVFLNPNHQAQNQDEASVLTVKGGGANPQMAFMQGFANQTMAQAARRGVMAHDMKVASVAHSNGCGSALCGHGLMKLMGVQSTAILLEPYRADEQANHAAMLTGLSKDQLKEGTTTIFASSDGVTNRFVAGIMGMGFGEAQYTIATGESDLVKNHGIKAVTGGLAAPDAQAPVATTPVQQAFNPADLISQLLNALVGGGELQNLFASLLPELSKLFTGGTTAAANAPGTSVTPPPPAAPPMPPAPPATGATR